MDKVAFGTGGLRGVMGDEPGNINDSIIQRVTRGLARKILSSDAPKSVGVAYDTRHNSAEFAKAACDTFSAFGIEVFTFGKPMPTPTLSFAIRHLKLGWGVCITASHNPQEYNGYKVYDKHGVQVTDRLAMEITDSINSVGAGEYVPPVRKELVRSFDAEVVEAYMNQIVSYAQHPKSDIRQSLSSVITGSTRNLAPYPLVYSALHGTGANAIPVVLERLGFNPICIQQNPDTAFGGLKTPNPEEPIVYEKAIEEAKKTGAMLILATDPDCDRVGVMEKVKDRFELLNGNQIGALLIDYLAQTRGVSKGENATSCSVVISTIVSGQLGELVAKEYGLEFVRLLTGFKYIGEYIVNLPKDKQFFFGYEESYGYLAGNQSPINGARSTSVQSHASMALDKDAVIASALIVKMAEYYDQQEMTLTDRLAELNEKHGYCLESLHSVNISQDKQKEIMSRFRNGVLIDSTKSIDAVMRSEDYARGLNGLPPSDVLKLYFTDSNGSTNTEAWAAIRPSGTEPKLKLYTGVRADTYAQAKEVINELTIKLLNEIDPIKKPGV
jgi:phosphoglucomutase